jgi:hypothetical protein
MMLRSCMGSKAGWTFQGVPPTAVLAQVPWEVSGVAAIERHHWVVGSRSFDSPYHNKAMIPVVQSTEGVIPVD